ncbi:MAG: carboxypeptidase M32, partial [Ketobacter sp.]
EHDFSEAIMATIHETGHGRYEQGLPGDWLEQPVGQSRGMAVHESQSLLFEMQIARSKPFLTFLQPMLLQAFAGDSDTSQGFSLDNILCLYREVKPGLIRTSADEVTYPLHIVLRYEIEKDLIAGNMTVADIPERWDSAMQTLLGISTQGNYKDGCMQDVHWPSGAIGYFPFYTLGAMLAAQLRAAIDRDCGALDTQLAQGDVSTITEWLRQRVWEKGCSLTSRELIESACGEALSPRYFLQHIRERYLFEN